MNTGGALDEPAGARPVLARIAATTSGASSWFLGEKTSIDGGTIQTRSAGISSQTNSRREKTQACASAM